MAMSFAYAADAPKSAAPTEAPVINQRGTEKASLVLRGLPPEKTKIDEERETAKLGFDRDVRDYAFFAWITALFALAVAAVQAWLFIRQLKLMSTGAKTAEEAARAASDSAKAALVQVESMRSIERAYVFVDVELDVRSGYEGAGLVIRPTVKVMFRNLGKTPAIVSNIQASCEITRGNPPVPLMPGTHFRLPPGMAISADQPYALRLDEGTYARFRQIRENGGQEALFCAGRIDYDDVMGVAHATGFCWRLTQHDGADGFSITSAHALNFQT